MKNQSNKNNMSRSHVRISVGARCAPCPCAGATSDDWPGAGRPGLAVWPCWPGTRRPKGGCSRAPEAANSARDHTKSCPKWYLWPRCPGPPGCLGYNSCSLPDGHEPGVRGEAAAVPPAFDSDSICYAQRSRRGGSPGGGGTGGVVRRRGG